MATGSKQQVAIGQPFNFEKKLHVDGQFQWLSEGDPREMFEIHEKLGEGAFGAVFKAVFKQTGFVIAIKEILVGKLNDRNSIQKEIDMLRQCRHRNTVQYFGCCNVDDDSIWILNDYCGAGSISDCIELTESTFTEPQIAIVLAAALEGLAFLHNRKIVHRDVKCANILLTENAVVKIGDFGVSEKLTQTVCVRNSIVGTPYWMSPEVITGSDYGTEADIWSLGITTIEMTDGVPPHSTVHPMRAMFKIPFLPPPTLLQAYAYSNTFNDFIAQCLVKDPKKRPSALDLLQHPFIAPYVGQQNNVALREPLMEKVQEVLARRRVMKKHLHTRGGKTQANVDSSEPVTMMAGGDLKAASESASHLLPVSPIQKPRGLSGSSVGSHGTVVIHSDDDGGEGDGGASHDTGTVMIHNDGPIYGSPQEVQSKEEYSRTMVIHAEEMDVNIKIEKPKDYVGAGLTTLRPLASTTDTMVIHEQHPERQLRFYEQEEDADVESGEEGRGEDGEDPGLASDVDAEFLITGGEAGRSKGFDRTGPRYAHGLSDDMDEEERLRYGSRKPRSTVATKLKKRLEKFRKTLKGNVTGDSGDEIDVHGRRTSRPSIEQTRSSGERNSSRSRRGGRRTSDVGQGYDSPARSSSRPRTKPHTNSSETAKSLAKSHRSGRRSPSVSSADSPRRSSDNFSQASGRSDDSHSQRKALTKIYEAMFGLKTGGHDTDGHGTGHLSSSPRSFSEGAPAGLAPYPVVSPLIPYTSSARIRSTSSMSLGKVDGEVDVNELVRIHDNLLKEIEEAKRAESGRWWRIRAPSVSSSHGAFSPAGMASSAGRETVRTGRSSQLGSKVQAVPPLEQADEQGVADEVANITAPYVGEATATFLGNTAVLFWKVGYVFLREFRSHIWLHIFYAIVIASLLWSGFNRT
ncbi:hypothetical protein HKX48_001697 [Thoreauomyces humboldtii]|nr:hypothetical protein HKX48_001697 [Thoreauomyces humboldtii]